MKAYRPNSFDPSARVMKAFTSNRFDPAVRRIVSTAVLNNWHKRQDTAVRKKRALSLETEDKTASFRFNHSNRIAKAIETALKTRAAIGRGRDKGKVIFF
jgi:hypothetical protein